MFCLKEMKIIYIFQIIANSLIFLKAVFRLFQQALVIAVLKRGEVCPMPYALCPMHVGYLMLLRKAIVIPLNIPRLKPILQKLSSQPRGTKRQAIKFILLLGQIFTLLAALTVQAKLQFSRDFYPIFLLTIFEYVSADAPPECPHSIQSHINSASIVGRKIESTVNTQLSFSFSTRPLTVNSQQSTVNNNSGATGIDISCISSQDA